MGPPSSPWLCAFVLDNPLRRQMTEGGDGILLVIRCSHYFPSGFFLHTRTPVNWHMKQEDVNSGYHVEMLVLVNFGVMYGSGLHPWFFIFKGQV